MRNDADGRDSQGGERWSVKAGDEREELLLLAQWNGGGVKKKRK